jgi:hypothetical protein
MKSTTLIKHIGLTLMVCGMLITHPFAPAAQEATTEQEGSGGHMGMPGMMGHGRGTGMTAEMQQHHEQMEKMHQEMSQDLEKQVAALRDHSKMMEGISDEKQLLTEMKKHQQMTDGLLQTMVEQREKMRARMKAHHEQMHGHMGTKRPTEKPAGEADRDK